MTTTKAALEALLEVHWRSEYRAAVLHDDVCAYCEDEGGPPLIRRERGYINDGKRKVPTHVHEDRFPVCETCAAGYEGRVDWPCYSYNLASDALTALVQGRLS